MMNRNPSNRRIIGPERPTQSFELAFVDSFQLRYCGHACHRVVIANHARKLPVSLAHAALFWMDILAKDQ
jgi:hypothetical protein